MRIEKPLAWVGTFLLAAVSAFIVYLLIAACSISWLPRWIVLWECSGIQSLIPAEDILRDLQRERDQLLDELAALERSVGRLQCDPVPPPPEKKAEPEPEQRAECAPEQKAVQTSEVVFIYDTSSSMNWSVDLPANLERESNAAWRRIEQAQSQGIAGLLKLPAAQANYQRVVNQMERYPGRKRRTVAREVTVNAIDGAPPNVNLGLVTFSECNPRSHGSFPPARRSQLKRKITGAAYRNSTPIARSITEAARILSGGGTADDPVNIVLLSDGSDSCKGDPCNAARRAKASKPGLVINVVDLSKTSQLKCVADATGGFYRRHQQGMDLSELSRSMREAAGYEGEGLCR